ncbi:MAG: sialate O-acetylesterase [Armatimonadetes bacterium]|nr:sialate O-acetylesterase [Armatimonadota bacterium]
MKIAMKISALLASLSVFCSAAHGDLKMPALFSDNMILQRNRSIPIWGTADAGEAVIVRLGERNVARARADAQGKWMVRLAPQEAATGLSLSVTGKNALIFRNVAVGEVWLCSGQSNMEFRVANVNDAAGEIAAANYPNLRLFNVARNATATPQSDVKGSWAACTPESVRNFSAVAYFFGRELHQKLGVPVGLIHSSWGGTAAEAWTSREALQNVPLLQPLVQNSDKLVENYPALFEKYQKETLPAWEAEVARAKAEGQPAPAKPTGPNAPDSPNRTSSLFNGMIAPLIPYGIKGVSWYQGESNAGRAEVYRTLFPTLISDWRARFGQGDFPFYWVQLANYQALQKEPVEGGWAMIREAQTLTLRLPRTGQALAIDLADRDNPGDIHPRNKKDVGHRLALLALNREYGQKTIDSGPIFSSMTVTGNQVRLSFQNSDGLKAAGAKLLGFAISGSDGVWKWADATIDGNQVVLSSPEVARPVAVRYGWASNPLGNLYNGANLPARPFRTDMDAEK